MTADNEQDEPFIRAWEDRAMRELSRDLGPIFRSHGVGSVNVDRQHAERRRVTALIERDRADRAADRMREMAEMEVAEGKFANLADLVIEPTPEQFVQAKRRGAAFRKFTPRQMDGTVRKVTTYRRPDLPQVQRLILSGVIDADGFRACLWYRNLYEQTGLLGNIGSIDYGREVFAQPQSRSMFAERQVEAQDTFRAVRSFIEARRLALLDKVAIEDVPLYRAGRQFGKTWRTAPRLFAEAVQQLVAARQKAGA